MENIDLHLLAHIGVSFRYIDAQGYPHEMESTGGMGGYYKFITNTSHMAFSLSELKRLHVFLGSVISNIEQKCASDPRFEAQVKGADNFIKNLEPQDFSPPGPRIVY